MKLKCNLCGKEVEAETGPEQTEILRYMSSTHLEERHTKEELAAVLRSGGKWWEEIKN